jgi:hypothetical protein
MKGIQSSEGIPFNKPEDDFVQIIGHFDPEETFLVQKKGFHDLLDYLFLESRLSFFCEKKKPRIPGRLRRR